MDDEWHALAKAASAGYGEIVLSFGLADHSIPVALAYRWLIGQGWLSEAAMFAGPFAAGVAACVGLVLAARRSVTPLALGLYAGLLATSPLLVLYARQARPYAVALCLALAAAWGAWRWWTGGKARHALLCLACGPLAVWFLPLVAPFVLGVWPVLLAKWLAAPRRERRGFASLVLVGGLSVLATAALIGPPFLHDLAVIRAKSAQDFPDLHAAVRTAARFAGTASALPALAMGLLCIPGVVLLARARPAATRYVLALLALQVATVLATRAYLLHFPIVLARYLLVLLPFLLLASAVGLAWVLAPLGRLARAMPPLLGLAALAALLALGPLPESMRYPNGFFGHHKEFFEFERAENPVDAVLREGPVPDFYFTLGREAPASRTVIEAPWRYESIFNRLPYFQQVHRQEVKIGLVGGLCPPGATTEQMRAFPNRFRRFVDLALPAERLRREADYVVFHRRLELRNLEGNWLYPGGRSLPPVEACIERFAAQFGPPVFEDRTITVFALAPR